MDAFSLGIADLLQRQGRGAVGRHVEALRQNPAGRIGRHDLKGDLARFGDRKDEVTTDHPPQVI